jgi:hypothetical protein
LQQAVLFTFLFSSSIALYVLIHFGYCRVLVHIGYEHALVCLGYFRALIRFGYGTALLQSLCRRFFDTTKVWLCNCSLFILDIALQMLFNFIALLMILPGSALSRFNPNIALDRFV